jgi:ribose transport system substrate-binding protein
VNPRPQHPHGTPARRRGPRLIPIAAVLTGLMTSVTACSTASSTTSGSQSTPGARSTGAAANHCPKGKGVVPADEVKAVAEAEKSSPPWDGPADGPAAERGKLIVDISQDTTNEGNNGVAAGLKEAAGKLGWKYKEINGGGTLTGMVSALHQAIALKPDGIALESTPTDGTLPELKEASRAGIVLVGWHVSNDPGKVAGTPLFWNVSTSPYEIARIAGDFAVVTSCGKAHAVELTDMTYPIDQEKDRGFKDAFRASPTSSLKVDDYPFGSRSTRTSGEITATVEKDKDVNWFVTINDSYFDYSIPALTAAGYKPDGPVLLNSAGDGSPSAFKRIRQGTFQLDTVPEPLNEQGWIMADELNRAFHHQKPFNLVTKPHLTVKANVDEDGGKNDVYDPANGYRDKFAALWKVG